MSNRVRTGATRATAKQNEGREKKIKFQQESESTRPMTASSKKRKEQKQVAQAKIFLKQIKQGLNKNRKQKA